MPELPTVLDKVIEQTAHDWQALLPVGMKPSAIYLGDLVSLLKVRLTGTQHRPLESWPTVVCLCGSTKFREQLQSANMRESIAGKIVLSVGGACLQQSHLTREEKATLDELHLRKIEIADEVHVVCPGGYIGESTKAEIRYAVHLHKPITFSDEPAGGREALGTGPATLVSAL